VYWRRECLIFQIYRTIKINTKKNLKYQNEKKSYTEKLEVKLNVSKSKPIPQYEIERNTVKK